jgi:hypothetical protein
MNEPHQLCPKNPYDFPGPDDPPRDWSREEAAYAHQRDRLVRDHPCKFVVVPKMKLSGHLTLLAKP